MGLRKSTIDSAARKVSGCKSRAKRRTYFTVEQNAKILHHYFSLEFELFTCLAGAVPLFPELHIKCELSHGLHTAMLRTRAIRERLSDFLMQEPEKQVHPEWSNFVRHLLSAPNPHTLFSTFYRVIRPAQLRCYELHQHSTLPVNDAPTCELFQMHLPGMRKDLKWGIG